MNYERKLFVKEDGQCNSFNYHPIPQIAIKAEYNYRNLKKGYNDEPSINIGIAYEGSFL